MFSVPLRRRTLEHYTNAVFLLLGGVAAIASDSGLLLHTHYYQKEKSQGNGFRGLESKLMPHSNVECVVGLSLSVSVGYVRDPCKNG